MGDHHKHIPYQGDERPWPVGMKLMVTWTGEPLCVEMIGTWVIVGPLTSAGLDGTLSQEIAVHELGWEKEWRDLGVVMMHEVRYLMPYPGETQAKALDELLGVIFD